MPRRREVPERPTSPDPKYESKLVARFIRSIMRDGKKSTAEKLLYSALDLIEKKSGESPLKMFEQAVENVRQGLRVRRGHVHVVEPGHQDSSFESTVSSVRQISRISSRAR